MVHEEAEERVQQGEVVRVRFHIIRYARIENVGKYQSCMVSKLRIIWKQTVAPEWRNNHDELQGNVPDH